MIKGEIVYEEEHLHVLIEFGGVAETCRLSKFGLATELEMWVHVMI